MNYALKITEEIPQPQHLPASLALINNWDTEFEKDVWDVRNLPGVQARCSRARSTIHFATIPAPFRPVMKRFIRSVLTHCSLAHADSTIFYCRKFINFYVGRYPEETNFRRVNREIVEAYIQHLRLIPTPKGGFCSKSCFVRSISALSRLLKYLEYSSAPEAPTEATLKLIWPGDSGVRPKRMPSDKVKYIPEDVLDQIDQHLHRLKPKRFIPAVIILRASGWRISDVLALRWDNCLEKTTFKGRSGWWLKGDIQKTQVENHRIPITDEVAQVVAAAIAEVCASFSDQQNPGRLMFPSKQERRHGLSVAGAAVRTALQKFVARCNITDHTGSLFQIGCHAFRHTKAVELINSGMPLAYVQEWLAHASPEMTLIYAKILDSTMRDKWDESSARGVVRISPNGNPSLVPTEGLATDDKIEWEYVRHNLDATRLPNGYCFKPKKQDCPTAKIPCHTCASFCTTAEFLPQFRRMRDEAQELIQIGLDAGRTQWAERNRENLSAITPIINLLEAGAVHHPSGKSKREYSREERIKMSAEKESKADEQ